MPSFDVIEERFRHHRVKAPKVVCQQCGLQAYGREEIPAPTNLTYVNGEFRFANQPVKVRLVAGRRSPQLLTGTVIPGKVMNTGVVYADLFITALDGERLYCQKNIPIRWHDVIKCGGAEPGDIVQKHDFQIEGFEDVAAFVSNEQLFLLLAVAVEYCLVVARESILKVNAAEPFC